MRLRSSLDQSWSSAAVFAVLTPAYGLLALSAFELFGALSIGVTFFPPAGLTFSAFLLLPRRLWPAVAASIVVGEVVVDMGQGQAFWWAMCWAAANSIEPFVGALVTRRLSPTLELSRRFAGALLVGGLVVGPVFGATIGASTLAAFDDLPWLSKFADIWVGDALGVLVVAPLIIVLARPSTFLFIRPGLVDTAVVVVATAVAGVLLFVADEVPVGYAVIPLLAVTAVRYSPRELALATAVVAAALTAATARGRGPWAIGSGSDTQQVLVQQQVFLLAAVTGAWFLKLEVVERLRAVHAAQQSEIELERALEQGRHQQGLAAMHDALSDLAAATSTAELIALLGPHAQRILDARAVLVRFDDDGGARQLAPDAPGATMVPDLTIDGDDPLAVASRTGRPVFLAADVDDPATTHRAAVPLNLGRRGRAALGLERTPARSWSPTARVRAMAFASIVGDALERLLQSEQDHEVALTLQRALIPDAVEVPAGLRVAGRYLPASRSLEVGGDWYDVVAGDDGRATVVIGDVVGHSLRAAAAMGQLAAAARALAYAGNEPNALVRALDLVAAHTPDALMTTMTCAVIDPATGTVTYSSAGHPPALARYPDGKVVELDDAVGPPLAVRSDADRHQDVVSLPPGSMLVFYTDGLVERRGTDLDERLERLADAVEATPDDPAEACARIIGHLLRGDAHDDDVALVCLLLESPRA